MNEIILFLSFCITIVALVAIGNQNDEIAKLAVAYLGEMAKNLVSVLKISCRPQKIREINSNQPPDKNSSHSKRVP